MSFTAERKLPLPRPHYACAEESQRHVPWIPAPSFDEERSSIAPHPHVDFEKPAPSPAVGSWIRCSFPWELTCEAVRNGIDWYWLLISVKNTMLIIQYDNLILIEIPWYWSNKFNIDDSSLISNIHSPISNDIRYHMFILRYIISAWTPQ